MPQYKFGRAYPVPAVVPGGVISLSLFLLLFHNREKFGDDAFILREERVHCEEPEPDYEAMTVKARAYAQVRDDPWKP
jgi:hypothetical protein